MFVIMFFCLPETLYLRGSTPVVTARPILRRMKIWGLRPEGKHLKTSDFFEQFVMFQYPTVLLTALYYSVTFTLSSILPAVTSATLFHLLYNFTASQTGLALGLGTLIGSTLGELLGGMGDTLKPDTATHFSNPTHIRTCDTPSDISCYPTHLAGHSTAHKPPKRGRT
ncbi:MFS general substrate transporter [Mycena sanguinolenta]|uniref:MFS general substrate transporter n=1 Tax=Mycena sanguinolenta TaxID=230812 RepID=A0A8H6YXW0_9AGAR|nr:MFS general substrate transporter [Mycena sanguinolenta]